MTSSVIVAVEGAAFCRAANRLKKLICQNQSNLGQISRSVGTDDQLKQAMNE